MALTLYTSAAEVRAALGVGSTDINDAVFTLPMHEFIVQDAMDEVSPLVAIRQAEIAALPEATRTPKQNKFFRLSKLFCTYALADHLTSSLPMFSAQKLEDGKGGFSRFSKALELSLQEMQGMYATFMYRLGLALNDLEGEEIVSTTYAQASFSILSPLGVDPVTGA